MKIKFDELEYQEKAISSVVNLFEGQGVSSQILRLSVATFRESFGMNME